MSAPSGMSIDEIVGFLSRMEAVLTLRPAPGDGSPEISWGDLFFYYAPDGAVPKTQPFATIVTKDYPGDDGSRLDRPEAFRLNVFAGKDAFLSWTGHTPRDAHGDGADQSIDDAVLAHPVYGSLGWLAVVNPGPRTEETVRELLRAAHQLARARYLRHHGSTPR